MTKEERKIALHCLKSYSDYHSEVCEECINYSNCDHTMQDDVTESIIKELEQEPALDKIKDYINHIRNTGLGKKKSLEFIEKYIDGLKAEREQFKGDAKIGKWTPGDPICPCCGEDKFKDLDADIWSDWRPQYCPNCGARMENEE